MRSLFRGSTPSWVYMSTFSWELRTSIFAVELVCSISVPQRPRFLFPTLQLGCRGTVHHSRFHLLWVLAYILKYVFLTLAYALFCLNDSFPGGRHSALWQEHWEDRSTGEEQHLPLSLTLKHWMGEYYSSKSLPVSLWTRRIHQISDITNLVILTLATHTYLGHASQCVGFILCEIYHVHVLSYCT